MLIKNINHPNYFKDKESEPVKPPVAQPVAPTEEEPLATIEEVVVEKPRKKSKRFFK